MKIKRGSTSVRRLIFIADTSSATGAGLANLVYNSSGLVAYYFAGDLNNEVQISLVTATLGTFASGGFIAVDNTNMPGWYEIGIPDAAFDGGNEVAIQLRGATNMAPVNIYIELDTVDYQTDAFGALKPTTAGRTLDVTSTGEAGIDWANIGSPTTSVNLSGTSISTSQAIASVSGAVGSVTSGVTVSTNNDKTGYSLTQAFPSNFSSLAITVGGAVTAGTVSDKTGYSLASGGLASVTAWSVAITGNITGNLSGSVGSVTSGVTVSTNNDKTGYSLTQAFPSNFSSLAIAAGTGAVTVNGDAFGNTLVLTNLANSSQIPAEFTSATFASTGVFATAALANAPAGGGGGSTDWTANERTAIRSILGIPTSGTTPTDPTVGILDTIRDTVGSIGLNVYPVSASTPERVSGTTLTFYLDESRSVSIATDFTLTSMTLEFTVEDSRGNDVYVVADGSITKSSQTATVPITSTVTGSLGQYAWSLRDITSGNSVIARGVLSVQNAASND